MKDERIIELLANGVRSIIKSRKTDAEYIAELKSIITDTLEVLNNEYPSLSEYVKDRYEEAIETYENK